MARHNIMIPGLSPAYALIPMKLDHVTGIPVKIVKIERDRAKPTTTIRGALHVNGRSSRDKF